MKNYTKTQKIIFVLLPFVVLPLIFFIGKIASNYTYLLPPCYSYTLFNFHCPGCGTTRAVLALLDGDILLSLRQNFLPVLGIIVALWLYIEFLFHVFNKKPPFTLLKTKYLWALLVVLIIYTVLRNVFPALAPI